MLKSLLPSPTLTTQEVQRSLRLMIGEGVASGAMFSLGSGGFMAAYALVLGASNLEVGLLAALPFITQIAQLPAILAVERFRKRKLIQLPAMIAAHALWLPIGAVPLLLETPGAPAVVVVIALLGLRGLFSSIWATTWNSWMRDLVPQSTLGSYYGRRLAVITGVVAVVGLGSSFFVQWWKSTSSPEDAVLAYSFLLIGGSLVFGLASPVLTLWTKEPLMPAAPESGRSAFSVLIEPLRDRNFSQLVRFLFAWNLALNLAIPFFAVYMLSELGLSLPVVIGFTVLSQVTNIVFVRVWGPMADRVGSKTVLSLSASLYLLVILGWVFTGYPNRHALTLPLLAVLHVFAGIASAGVYLTMSTLTLKVAPDGKATAFMGVAGVASSVGAGIGPIAGGVMADFFAVRTLGLDLTWTSPGRVLELPALALSGFDFLFVIAFVLGLLALNLLVALREEGEVSRDVALRQLAARASPATQAVSSVPGIGAVSAFSYGYLKRVPGADVAVGVTAYQLAASAQAAVSSAGRGRALASEVASAVGNVMEQAIDEMEDATGHGIELARHVTRGAIHVGDHLTEEVGRVARGAVLGTLRTLVDAQFDKLEALRGSGYGVVQGAVESGADPAEAVSEAIEAARELASDIGLTPEEAAATLAEGALEAAEADGDDTLTRVSRALPVRD